MSLAGAIDVQSMREQQAKLDPAKVALTLAAILPFLIGWALRKVALAVWLVGSWLFVAAREGWKTAAPPDDGRPR